MSDHHGIKILIDSGAFSTWTKGEKIDIRRYAKFLHKHHDRLFGYFNLDVIPGSVGKPGDLDNVEESAKESYKNFEFLLDQGLEPIPVFHAGERIYWLEKIIDSGANYIALAPLMIGSNKVAQKHWLDLVWSRLINQSGSPIAKVHCLGLTSYDVITRYPWFSLDSTSWKMDPAYGGAILIPQYEDGRWNFALRPERVILSGERNLTFGSHFRELENLSDAVYNRVRYYVEDIVETTFSELRYFAPVRSRTAVYVNERLCDAISEKPIRIASAGLKLFGGHSLRKSVEIRRPLFAYAAASSANYFRNMIKGTGRCALYSFAEMQHGLTDFMEAVLSGELPSGRDEFKPNWKSEAYLNARRMNLIDRIRSNEDA